jgi:hypothetical protein
MEDKKLKEALLQGTDEAVELKDMVWNNIERELNLDRSKKKNMTRSSRRKKNNISSFVRYGSIAAAVAIVIGMNTQYGQAAVGKIKEIFVPNKVVKQELEGTTSENKVTLKESSMKYVIYIDEELYTMQSSEGKDKIVTKNKYENFPEVFMEIQQIKDKKPGVVASELQKELKGKFKKVDEAKVVKEPVNSTFIYANNGSKWNDTVVKYYLVDNTKGGTFIIKEQLFLEASEGHGARFDNMVKEFKVVNE